MFLRTCLAACLALMLGMNACEPVPPEPPAEAARYTVAVVNTYPHDAEAYTQGLCITPEGLFEGTGLYGQSSLRRVDLETGDILQQTPVDQAYFGEGIAVLGERIYQLTWKAGTGFIYDRDSFARLDTFAYEGEGWGLTHDGERLIMSDGTAWLRFLDPDTLAETGRVEVHTEEGLVNRLNELEYIDGRIYANIWQTDYIVIIDPADGAVVSWVDLRGLLPDEDRTLRTDVLNGIAWDAAEGRLYVTGKRWPKLFEIELVPANETAAAYASPDRK